VSPSIAVSLPIALAALHSSGLRERLVALERLGDLGPTARQALPALVRLLADPDESVETAAARAIRRVGPDDVTVEALTQRLATSGLGPIARTEMACAMTGTSRSDMAVTRLGQALAEPDEIAAARAAECLGEIGGAAAPTVPDLARLLLARRGPFARSHAAQALGRIGPPAADAIPSLVQASQDTDPNVARAAQQALARLRAAPPS
jgi:HEAT repeat protein